MRLRTSRDREFERSGVNLLCYIEKRNGTAVLLREIKNFERSEFEPSKVTCNKLINNKLINSHKVNIVFFFFS